MKKVLRKTMLASAITIAAILPTTAQALPHSYFSDLGSKSTEQQISFINRMLPLYYNNLNAYNKFVKNFAPWSYMSFYQGMVDSRDWYEAEIELYENKLAELQNPVAAQAEVVVTDTQVSTSVSYTTESSEPVEIDSYEDIVEETVDNMVYVYSMLTSVLQTTITTTETTTTTTVTYYSDNTSQTSSSEEVTNTTVEYSTENVVTRSLIEQYARGAGDGVRTEGVLTLEEYNAREDVNYAGTQAYIDAMQKGDKWYFYDKYMVEGGTLYKYGNNLDVVNAPEAWAKGWTGEGSLIAILDTGIDTDHSEFEGKIKYTHCFAACDEAEGVEDLNGHGTHVAGIAAANFDGVGVTGVAYDADLLIAKVGDQNGGYDLIAATEALRWASNEGAVVANMSGGKYMPESYVDALTQISAGDYQLIDYGADNTANQQLYIDGNWAKYGIFTQARAKYDFEPLTIMMENFTDTEMVLVIASGNDGQPVANFPSQYAYMADQSGELVFGGRIIVAGSWDQQHEELAWYSNAAGTVCIDTPTDGTSIGGNTCENSDYRVKDFYLMAPGTYVMSASNDGGYEVRTGTSMAAPTIAGGVALIHQMWPHMKGEHLVDLLMLTADKDIPNYDENIHGQGIMDLDVATQPIGSLGIPTTGRAEGDNISIYGGMKMGTSGATIGALEELMVVDAFDRDFYVDANEMIERVDTRTMSYTVAQTNDSKANPYSGYAFTQNAVGENMSIGASENMESLNVTYDFDNGVRVGYLKEEFGFLGNVAQSNLMKVDGSETMYLGYNAEKEMGDTTVFGGVTVGFTRANVDSTSLLKGMDTLVSNSANLGMKLALNDSTDVGLVASLPVAITGGEAHFRTAQDIDDEGNISYANVSSSMVSDAREVNVGAFYNFNEAKQYGDVVVSAFVEERFNYLGQEGENATAAGIKMRISF